MPGATTQAPRFEICVDNSGKALANTAASRLAPIFPLLRIDAWAKDKAMSNPRIIHVELDEQTIIWRNADIEQERRIAIFDLIEDNYFKPLKNHPDDYAGPYRLSLAVHEGRLVITIAREDETPLETLILGLGRFRRPIREYFAICDSYYQAIRKASAQEIETIDMARRGVHNQAAELLIERLEGKIEIDFPTARRLFTLICVLHIKG